MGRGPWRSLRDFILELGLYQPRVLEVLHDDLLQPNRYLWSSSTFADDRILRMEWLLQHAAGELVHNSLWIYEACFTREFLFSVHKRPFWTRNNNRPLAVVDIKSASALTFGLVSSGTLWWARPLTGWLTAHRYRNFLETVYWSCVKMEDRCAFSTTEFQHTVGTCRVVAQRGISCYSYGVTIVWCMDVLRHLTVTCKTTVFEKVFDF